ncbi:MAG: cellulase family glycosylhydrolase [Chloroflexi bacterium]|nr:cellulase family glycosylhydrolase [Chloroflexota bacterium]
MKLFGRVALIALVPLALVVAAVSLYPASDLVVELKHGWVAATSRVQAPAIDTADRVAVSPRVENPLGVNTFLEQEPDPAVRRRSLELIRAAGIHWVRQEFRWEEIEPRAPGVYVDPKFGTSTWEKYDHIVALANELGLELILRLDTSPEWARSPASPDGHAPPLDLGQWERFVRAVAERYRGRVRHYQVWNEPNLDIEWGRQAVDPAAYTRLLEAAHRAIKGVDASAVVLSAALAPTRDERPEALNELIFLQRLYDAGASAFFDVLATNAYGLRSGPDDRRLDYDDVNFSRPMRVREVMVRNGDAHKPIWASEMGWNAAPPDLPGPNDYGSVSLRLQARYTVRAFERAHAEWPWMGVMAVWYFKRPDLREQQQAWYYFRMMEPDFTPLPLYHVLQRYAREQGYLAGER